MFLAEIMAYQGKYQEAAKLFAKAGCLEKCVLVASGSLALRPWPVGL